VININNLLNQFSQKGEIFKSDTGLELYVGFSMHFPDSLRFNLMRKGNWGVLYFACNEKKMFNMG